MKTRYTTFIYKYNTNLKRGGSIIENKHITYKVKEVPIKRLIGQTVKEELQVFIVRTVATNFGNTISIPSVFSSFAQDSGNAYNSRLKHSRYICDFLNYVLTETYEDNEDFIDIKQKGFYALKFSHAASYLNYCIQERQNSHSTSKSKEATLLTFYDYLNLYKVIDVNVEKKVYTDKNCSRREYIKSPFNSYENRVTFPEKIGNSKKLKNMESHIFKLFLKCCDEFCPELKLGIYLQTMGGLRLGEVVNCTLDSISIKKESRFSSVDVLDNQTKLFPVSTKSNESNQVKKPRYNQVLLDPDNKLSEIYENHLILINSRRNAHTPKDALFIDKKGNAMTGVAYKNRFYTLKKYFLNKLKDISYSDFHELNNRPWGTHIGRGIFTNYCIVNGYCNTSDGIPSAVLLAKLRGDNSLEASQAYIDELPLLENRKREINGLKSNIKNKLKDDKLW